MDARLTFTKKHHELLAGATGPVVLNFTPRQLRGKTIVRLTPKQAVAYQLAVQTNTPLTLKLSKKQAGGFLGAILNLVKGAIPGLISSGAKALGGILGDKVGGLFGNSEPVVPNGPPRAPGFVYSMGGRGGGRDDRPRTLDRNLLAQPAAAGDVVIGAPATVTTTVSRKIPSVAGAAPSPVTVRGNPMFY